MTTKFYLTIGLPASGKTTFYTENLNPDTVVRISRDDINAMLTDNLFNSNINKLIKSIEKVIAEESIKQGYSVYIDRTNLTPKVRKRFINYLKELKPSAYLVALYFEPNLLESLERNKTRTDKPLHQIEGIEEWLPSAITQITKPEFEEGFDEIITIDINGQTKNVERLREIS